jgi:ribonuclease BN (tRNA processing enzyme)
VRITVLGKSPAWQDAGGACSGYLVESGGTRLLLDCGCGVLGKLRTVCDYAAVDAVVISHLHADHILDLIPFASALTYGPRTAAGGPRPALHVPPGGRARLSALSSAAGMTAEHVERAFALAEYDPAATMAAGALRVRFRAVPHYVETHAVEISNGAARLTFGADSGPSDDLCDFARDTDLLLIEATLDVPDDAGDGDRGHLTPREAGEHGRRAGARRLVLTHMSDELDADAARAEAVEGFGGAVELAAEGAVYDI